MVKLAGSVTRVATPLRAWAPRFAFFFLILLAFGLMVIGRSDLAVVERARVAVVDGVTPLLDLISRPVDSLGDAITTAEELANLRAENENLRLENERLLQWQAAARHLEAENDALRALTNLTPDPGMRHISARTVGDPGGTFVRSVLINAGASHGVNKGQAAVTGDGLAGRVAEVGRRSARVLLITDINSRIPVLVGQGRDRAVLGGDNSAYPKLLYLGPRVTVKPGDQVVTSGHGGIFPPDLPVGVVSKVTEAGPQLQPFVDWSHMEFLRLIDYEMPEILGPFQQGRGPGANR